MLGDPAVTFELAEGIPSGYEGKDKLIFFSWEIRDMHRDSYTGFR
jgi:hypothetical protein